MILYMWFTDMSYYKLAVEKDSDSIFTTISSMWKPGFFSDSVYSGFHQKTNSAALVVIIIIRECLTIAMNIDQHQCSQQGQNEKLANHAEFTKYTFSLYGLQK